MDDAQLAFHLAKSAGDLLLKIRHQSASSGISAKQMGDAGDAQANRLIMDALRQTRPEDGLLSEEEADNRARLNKSRVWIIDPLDGTREYSEGRDDWAVHVALCVDGVPAVAAVAMPMLQTVYESRSVAPLQAFDAARLRIVVSRSRPPAVAERVAKALSATLVPMGSAGAKAMAVLRGEADAYIHAGGQHEWDSAAPVGVALAAGLVCKRLDGSPLRYNQAVPSLPDFVICRTEIYERIVAAMA